MKNTKATSIVYVVALELNGEEVYRFRYLARWARELKAKSLTRQYPSSAYRVRTWEEVS